VDWTQILLAAITVGGTTATAIFAGRVGHMHRSVATDRANVATDRRFIEQSLRPPPGEAESIRTAATVPIPEPGSHRG
jgi:hypothetical protein